MIYFDTSEYRTSARARQKGRDAHRRITAFIAEQNRRGLDTRHAEQLREALDIALTEADRLAEITSTSS